MGWWYCVDFARMFLVSMAGNVRGMLCACIHSLRIIVDSLIEIYTMPVHTI